MKSPKIVDGDLVLDENGDIVMVQDDEDLLQSIRLTLQTRKGEFFLEEDHGLSYESILDKQANTEEAHEDIVEAVFQDERISLVEEISFKDNRKERIRNVDLTLQKENGEIITIERVDLGAG